MRDMYRVLYVKDDAEKVSVVPESYEAATTRATLLGQHGITVLAVMTEEAARKHILKKEFGDAIMESRPATAPEDELTIPQIMRGLSTLSDRHGFQLRAVRDEMREIVDRKDKQIAEYDRQIQYREDRIQALERIVDELDNKLAAIRLRAKHNLGFAVETDTSALIELLGAEQDPFDRVRELVDKIRKEQKGQDAEDTPDEAESPNDLCACGHTRRRHTPRLGSDWPGAQCDDCPGDSERSWRHPFALAVL